MLSNSAGQFVDASALLPQSFAYTHDLSSGVIDSAGDKAIFFNNVYSQPNTPLWYVIANGNRGGTLVSQGAQGQDQLALLVQPHT